MENKKQNSAKKVFPPRIEVFTVYEEYQKLDSFMECSDVALKNVYLSIAEHEHILNEQHKADAEMIRELEKYSQEYIIYYNMYNIALGKLALAVKALNKCQEALTNHDWYVEKSNSIYFSDIEKQDMREALDASDEALERIKGSEGEK